MREFEATGARAAVGDLISVSLLFPQTANCVKMFASGVKRWTARAADLCPRQSEEAACRGIKKEKRHLQSVKVVNYICWRDFCRSECSFLAARAGFEYSDLSQKKKSSRHCFLWHFVKQIVPSRVMLFCQLAKAPRCPKQGQFISEELSRLRRR